MYFFGDAGACFIKGVQTVKYEKNRKIAGIDEVMLRKAGKFLILPLIAVILIVVILVSGKGKKGSSASSAGSAGGNTDMGTDINGSAETPDNGKYTNDFSNYGLQKNTVPEIDQLVADYQKAKLSANAEAMYKVYGKTDKTGLAELQSKLDEQKKVYEKFQDTVNYILPGAEENSYIVYTGCSIKFRGIDTLAPSLTREYVVKGSSGNYTMKEDLTDAEQKRVDEANRSEDVRLMDSQTRKDLAKAVISDAKLGSLYEMLLNSGGTKNASGESTSAGESTSEEETVQEITVVINGGGDKLTETETSAAEESAATATENASAAAVITTEAGAGTTAAAAAETTGETAASSESAAQ